MVCVHVGGLAKAIGFASRFDRVDMAWWNVDALNDTIGYYEELIITYLSM